MSREPVSAKIYSPFSRVSAGPVPIAVTGGAHASDRAFSSSEVGFDVMEIDRALRESAIPTHLTVEIQRQLVAQVLLGASLATTVIDDAEFQNAIARLSQPIEDDEERRFAYAFAQTLINDLREEFGSTAGEGDAGASLTALAHRLDQFV